MSKVTNVRYFLDREIKGYDPSGSGVFLTYENAYGDTLGYNPDLEIDHSFSHDGIDYLELCTEISLDEYKELSKGYNTPSPYLVDELEWFEEPKNVKEFLQNASNYIKINGEYASDDPNKPIQYKTDKEVELIMSDRLLFEDYYDVLVDEASYRGFEVEEILSEIDRNKNKIKPIKKLKENDLEM